MENRQNLTGEFSNPLPKFIADNNDLNSCFNITFAGPYELLKYIIQKYNLYNGQIMKFIQSNHYSTSSSHSWKEDHGVNIRVWNMIHKDLIIARLVGKIKDEEAMTLEELKEEFMNNKKSV